MEGDRWSALSPMLDELLELTNRSRAKRLIIQAREGLPKDGGSSLVRGNELGGRAESVGHLYSSLARVVPSMIAPTPGTGRIHLPIQRGDCCERLEA